MTEQTQPTDAEILDAVKHLGAAMLSPVEVARAVLAKWGTPAGAGPVEWPTTCDGKEQEAWETWAQTERYDMTQHPLHYLFLNERTYAARQGWKAGLLYAVEQMKSAAPQPTQAQAGEVPLTVQYPEGYGNPLAKIAYDAGWRAAEHAHGIKGADHG